MWGTGTELLVVARKSVKADRAKGQHCSAVRPRANQRGRSSPPSAKPFAITKREVWEAYQQVRSNRGAAGVDGESLEMFERNLADNLYQLWNRMSSGTYFPPPVREVLIPKADGGQRALGVPTVADRIAQTVVKRTLEPLAEPHFDEDSYGYRPGKRAHDAVDRARVRCRGIDWVLDLDIKAFFDSLEHDLVMRAVEWFTKERWVLLYIRRWLEAPILGADGMLRERTKGSPQGGVISPLLANVFMHFAFDRWFRRTLRDACFERYADDIVVHCRTEAGATEALRKIRDRLSKCGLTLHPEKTKIVYCQDARRRKQGYAHTAFDFLSFTFRQRPLKIRGRLEMRFTPAASKKALKRIRRRCVDGRSIERLGTKSTRSQRAATRCWPAGSTTTVPLRRGNSTIVSCFSMLPSPDGRRRSSRG